MQGTLNETVDTCASRADVHRDAKEVLSKRKSSVDTTSEASGMFVGRITVRFN